MTDHERDVSDIVILKPIEESTLGPVKPLIVLRCAGFRTVTDLYILEVIFYQQTNKPMEAYIMYYATPFYY